MRKESKTASPTQSYLTDYNHFQSYLTDYNHFLHASVLAKAISKTSENLGPWLVWQVSRKSSNRFLSGELKKHGRIRIGMQLRYCVHCMCTGFERQNRLSFCLAWFYCRMFHNLIVIPTNKNSINT